MYLKRYIERDIERKLRSSGAVLVAGPRFCGKTTTCMRLQKSVTKLNTKQVIDLARLDPASALKGEVPHLIDEWQTVPDLWNYIKEDLDAEYRFGKYILTGSSTPADRKDIHHAGTGRIAPLKMRTLSLFESQESVGTVSLKRLFDGEEDVISDLNESFSLDDAAHLICRGGWPVSVLADREISLDITANYYNGMFLFEDSDNPSFRNKKPELLRMILRSYARNISTEAPNTMIMEDVKQVYSRTLDPKTFDEYVTALRDMFIIEDLPAWNPNIRSKTAVRTGVTRHFTDTSIACSALHISPGDLKRDLQSFGFFFEDFAVKELSVYAGVMQGEIRHYRDNTGLECDAVIHLPDGRWAAVEIKLGGERLTEDGAKTLKRLRDKLAKKSDEPQPSFMMILTAAGACYKREDGIYVVPVNMLRD